MEILLLVLSIICCMLGLIGCILPILPGPPLSYAAMWLLHWSGYVRFSTTEFVVWGAIMVVVVLIDIFLAPWMTKRFGGSTAGIWGSVVGLFVGMFLPWPVGPLMGPFLGAFAGEMLVSKKDSGSAMHAALGSFLSFFVGTGLKLLICVGMLLAAIYSM